MDWKSKLAIELIKLRDGDSRGRFKVNIEISNLLLQVLIFDTKGGVTLACITIYEEDDDNVTLAKMILKKYISDEEIEKMEKLIGCYDEEASEVLLSFIESK